MQLETDSWACIPKVQCTAKMRPSRLATQSVGKPGLRDQSLRKGKQSERDRQTLDTKLESQNMGPHCVSIVVWAGGKQARTLSCSCRQEQPPELRKIRKPSSLAQDASMDFCRQAQSFKPLASCCSTCATCARVSVANSTSRPYLVEVAGNGMGAAGMHGLVWLNAVDVFTVGLEEWHVTERWWQTLQCARITKQLPAVEIYGGERICFEYQNTRPQKT